MGITSRRDLPQKRTITLQPSERLTVVAEPPAPPVVVNNAMVLRWLTERRGQVLKLQSQPGCGMERKIKYAGQLAAMAELRKYLKDLKRKR